MPTYYVTVREVYIQTTMVDADSTKQAVEKVADGEGKLLEDSFEYSHTQDPEYWNVYEVK